MDLYRSQISIYIKRIMHSRIRLLVDKPFYGMLMMHMKVFLGERQLTVWIENGNGLFFNPGYLQEVSDRELDKAVINALDGFVENIFSNESGSGKDYDWENEEGNDEIGDDSLENSESKEGEDDTGEEGKEYGEGGTQCYKTDTLKTKEDKFDRDIWLNRIIKISETIINRNSSTNMGGIPKLAQRLLEKTNKRQIDWREILNNFVQEEITDYSFSPPDRRFDDFPFFLPDFNEKEEKIGNIWFVIDTSGSISDAAISTAYSEICNAIEQFAGKLEGSLSFTEAFVTDPVPFSTVDELMAIKPVGGGGNDFSDIFRYMKDNMIENLPSQIIIITDGYDTFPKEEMAMGVPVLWLINNEIVNPPWGKVARIKV